MVNFIQSATTGQIAFSAGFPHVQAFLSGNTAHSTLLVFVVLDNTIGGTPTFTVTDSNGNIYTQVGSYVDVVSGGPSNNRFAVFMAVDVLAGANTISMTPTFGSFGGSITIVEYSGAAGVAPLIDNNSPGGTGTSTPSVILTTTQPNQLAAIFWTQNGGIGGTVGYPSGFTLRSGSNPTIGGGATLLVSATIAAATPGGVYSFTNSDSTAVAWAFGVVLTDQPTLVSISVTPSNPSVAVGVTQQFIATATYSDSSTADVTNLSIWTSSDPSKATINSSTGFATTVAVGTTTIEAAIGAISGTTILTVTAATLVSIAVTPTTASIGSGGTQQYVAIGTFSDTSTGDITSSSVWSSSVPAAATINASTGLATGVAAGSTNITATKSSITSNTAVLTVTLLSISGNAGHAGVTISYSGPSSGSVVADIFGNFSIPGLASGVYLLSPTLVGFTFSPASQNATVSGTNVINVNFTSTVNPPPSQSKVLLPFSQRTTCATAVFSCLLISSPAEAQRFARPNPTLVGALMAEYSQLNRIYHILRHQDVSNQRTKLVAAVATALGIVTSLNTTIQSLSASGNDASVLADMKNRVAGALVQIQNVHFDEI
jgi:uncharacterized protein YjdB